MSAGRYRVRSIILEKLGVKNPYPNVKVIAVLNGSRLDDEIKSALKRNPAFKGAIP